MTAHISWFPSDVPAVEYPHGCGCLACWQARKCSVCGLEMEPHRTGFNDGDLCTNGRCPKCHAGCCTQGGSTGPGHGYGKFEAAVAAKAHREKERGQ